MENPVKITNKTIGNFGEDKAAQFLVEKGFEIITRNYRSGKIGEIDIIAKQNNLILFVEVKLRKTDRFGGAIYSITSKKKLTIKKTASHFLLKNPLYNNKNYTFRFDFISIDGNNIEWINDIIR